MKVGVIGAGTMGQGIAKAFAMVDGYEVALCDIKQEWADGGKDKIAKGYARLVEKGKLTQEKVDSILNSITTGLKEDLCADCDLIVEAAFENMEVKKTTFAELDKICKEGCVFASNTSSLSITEIGNGLSRPLVGMHFFNPADRMKLIEVIAGVNTPAETVDTIKKISEEIGERFYAKTIETITHKCSWDKKYDSVRNMVEPIEVYKTNGSGHLVIRSHDFEYTLKEEFENDSFIKKTVIVGLCPIEFDVDEHEWRIWF